MQTDKTPTSKHQKHRKTQKDAPIKKWREPSPRLLQAIKEVENGEVERYESVEELKRAIEEEKLREKEERKHSRSKQSTKALPRS